MTTGTWTRSRLLVGGVPVDPLAAGVWSGDDHSRVVAFEGDMTAARVATGGWIEVPWGRVGNTGSVGFSALGANTPDGASSVRSVDIGFCSQSVAWTTAQASGLADQIANSLMAKIETPLLTDTAGWVFAYHNETPRFRVEFGVTPTAQPAPSADRLCFHEEFNADIPNILCHVDRLIIDFCGTFATVPSASGPDGARDAAFVVSIADEDVTVWSRIPVSSIRRPGCSPAHQGAVKSAVLGQLRDPSSGVAARIGAALNDALWYRGIPGTPSVGVGCDAAPDPAGFCHDVFADFGFPSAWRTRCMPGVPGRCAVPAVPPSCGWNLEIDRFESMPSRLELVLADSRDDETASLLATLSSSDWSIYGPLCRPGGVETGSVGGVLAERTVAVPPPPVPCDMAPPP